MKFFAFLFLSLMSCTVACAQMKTLTSKQNKTLLQAVKASSSNKHALAIQQIEKLSGSGVEENSSYHFFANSVYYNYFSYSCPAQVTDAIQALDKSLYHLVTCNALENAHKLTTYATDNRVRLEQTLSLVESFTNTLYTNKDFKSMDKLTAVLHTYYESILNQSAQADASFFRTCNLGLKAAIENKSKKDVLYFAEILGSQKNLSKEERLYLLDVLQSSKEEKSAFSTALQGITEFPSEQQFMDKFLEISRFSSNKGVINALLQQSSSSNSDIVRLLSSGCLSYNQNRYNEAYDSLKALLSAYPASSGLYSMVAESCLKGAITNELSGQREDSKIREALSLFLKVREMNPQHKQEWANGLYSIYQRLQMFDKLKEIEPYI